MAVSNFQIVDYADQLSGVDPEDLTANTTVHCKGQSAVNDGGSGDYWFDNGSTSTVTNDCISAPSGRWKRKTGTVTILGITVLKLY